MAKKIRIIKLLFRIIFNIILEKSLFDLIKLIKKYKKNNIPIVPVSDIISK